jgi:1L-myo-inositol 1-phosphate cytidylyltransferase
MPDTQSTSVTHAVVLAAGNGDRFHNGASRSKLLTLVAGTPLLIRTIESARAAGITDAHVVLGYDADRVRALAEARCPHGLRLHFHVNPDWHQENGRSVLTARDALDGTPFALLMGDHIFDPGVLAQMANAARLDDETLLAVDSRPADATTALEATKVRLENGRVTAIGKTVHAADAIDTGLFVCSPVLFGALDESCAAGDTTLSGGIGRLAARGLVRAVDIGDARWCDIDTVADLGVAEQLVGEALVR